MMVNVPGVVLGPIRTRLGDCQRGSDERIIFRSDLLFAKLRETGAFAENRHRKPFFSRWARSRVATKRQAASISGGKDK